MASLTLGKQRSGKQGSAWLLTPPVTRQAQRPHLQAGQQASLAGCQSHRLLPTTGGQAAEQVLHLQQQPERR
jgi:hypothetical protein